MQVMAKEGNKVKEGSEASIDLSSDEFHWGKLSLGFINDVKTHLPSYSPSDICLISRTEPKGKDTTRY